MGGACSYYLISNLDAGTVQCMHCLRWFGTCMVGCQQQEQLKQQILMCHQLPKIRVLELIQVCNISSYREQLIIE